MIHFDSPRMARIALALSSRMPSERAKYGVDVAHPHYRQPWKEQEARAIEAAQGQEDAKRREKYAREDKARAKAARKAAKAAKGEP